MTQEKVPLFSVTKHDFVIQTFSVGGHGGGGKDTSNSGVRLIHPASGARGEGREHRSNTANRKSAFMKLVNTTTFQNWLRVETARRLGSAPRETAEEVRERVDRGLDEDLKNGRVKVEYYEPAGTVGA